MKKITYSILASFLLIISLRAQEVIPLYKGEIPLYKAGGHGFGLNNKMSEEKWADWLKAWLKQQQFLN